MRQDHCRANIADPVAAGVLCPSPMGRHCLFSEKETRLRELDGTVAGAAYVTGIGSSGDSSIWPNLPDRGGRASRRPPRLS
jgi:hypothetical protein